MVSSIFTMLALAGSALAFTPAGFEPASKGNLTVAYGNTLAIDGKEIQKAGMLAYCPHQPSLLTTCRDGQCSKYWNDPEAGGHVCYNDGNYSSWNGLSTSFNTVS